MVDADILRLQRDQVRQQAMKPLKIAQKIFRDWCGSNMVVMDAMPAADLVKRIEAAIVAERQR